VQRQIDAPEWEWGSAEQAAAWLAIEPSALNALIDQELFPMPVVFNRNNKRWHWSTVYAFGVLAPWLLSDRAVKSKAEKS